jgi:hypothetical protein
MAGTLTVDTIQSALSTPTVFKNTSGTEIGQLCRSWCNYSGTGTAILASFNISSVTKPSGGIYVNNLATAMGDANYSVGGTVKSDNTNSYAQVITVQTSTGSSKTASVYALRSVSSGPAGAATGDYVEVMSNIFR